MEVKVFTVLEWTIENFSCWNGEVHEKAITSSDFSTQQDLPQLKLYPRGPDGYGELLEVHICGDYFHLLHSGDLSLIGSDGIVFCTRQIDVGDEWDVKIVPGPKFAEIVTRTRMSEEKHKDQLTVRVRMSSAYNQLLYMRTAICVHGTSVKISGQMFDKFNWPNRGKALISSIKYPFGEGNTAVMYFRAVGKGIDHSTMYLQLEPEEMRKNSLICTSTSVKAVLRTEQKEHVIRDEEPWTILSSIRRDEFGAHDLLVNIKEVPGNICELQCEYHSGKPKFVDVTPASSLRLYSDPDEDSVQIILGNDEQWSEMIRL